MTHQPLGPADYELLEFARIQWPSRSGGARDAAILDCFGDTPTRYHQRLDLLLDHPDALAYDPHTVNRLRNLRAARRDARTAGSRTA